MTFKTPFNGLKLDAALYANSLNPLVTFSSLVEIAALYRHEPSLDVAKALEELKDNGVDVYDMERYNSVDMSTIEFSNALAILFYQDPTLIDNSDATFGIYEDLMTFCMPDELSAENIDDDNLDYYDDLDS